ncbi:MAG: EF-P beta-lysylation protein EpmB [Wenzhouxiangellaceae bacterium]|nr:EF-P beta-lysylation protein EpmB [Wenzhouxiangellaceae bacterium]
MIPVKANPKAPDDWRAQLRSAWRDPRALLEHLELDAKRFSLVDAGPFPIRVPRAFSNRMRRGDADDPLLRQVLPLAAENQPSQGFVSDPVGDAASRASGGVLHKYHGRALLIATGACAIHCRYCFRREFDYADSQITSSSLAAAADYIRASGDISEVILSGGDPWMLSNERLARISDALADIPALERLRIHTRMPITLPDRVDSGLLDWLKRLPWQTVVVVHANHAQEFDDEVDAALARLRQAGATIFNQAVLLAGVNDRLEDLHELMKTGFRAGAIPYYLHLLDRVSGSAHFEVGSRQAGALMDQLRRKLPGYLVPRLVREQAGAPYKLPIF